MNSGLVLISYQIKEYLPESRQDDRPWSLDMFDIEEEPEIDSLPVEAILSALDDKPDWKQAFILHTFKEYSQDEIAALMSVTPSTVRSYLFKARKCLRQSKLVQEIWG